MDDSAIVSEEEVDDIVGFDDATLGCYDAVLLGSKRFSEATQDSDMEAMYLALAKTKDIRNVKVTVTASKIILESSKGSMIHESPIAKITYAAALGAVSKKAFAFVTRSEVFGIKEKIAMFLKTNGKTKAVDVPAAINDAFSIAKGIEAPFKADQEKKKRLSKKKMIAKLAGKRHASVLGEILKAWPANLVSSTEIPVCNEQAVQDAIHSTKVSSDKVEVILSNSHLEIHRIDRLDVLMSDPLPEVKLIIGSHRRKRLIGYVVKSVEKDSFMCHVLKLKSIPAAIESVASVTEMVAAANDDLQTTPENVVKYRRKTVSAAKTSIHTAFTVISLGIFVQRDGLDKGNLVNAAIKYFTTDAEEIKPMLIGVNFIVTANTVKAMDSRTGEVLEETALDSVSYTMQGGKKGEYFAYISQNDMIGLKICHVFTVPGGSKKVLDVLACIQEARKRNREAAHTNPFAPSKPSTHETQAAFATLEIIDRTRLSTKKTIGSGQFGQVYHAEYTGEIETVQVAVKVLTSDASTGDSAAEFINESKILDELRHTNVCKLLGVSITHNPWLIVLEYMCYGDLRSILLKCKERQLELSTTEHLRYSVQVLSGMTFISSKNVIHMDVAARNILIGPQNLAKIGDFGLARHIGSGGICILSSSISKLPMKWLSPEAMDSRKFSEASDVWAFGVLLWEQFSYGIEPYTGLRSKDVQIKVRGGLRLQQPQNCPDSIYAVMNTCWHPSRQERPKFAKLERKVVEIVGRDKLFPEAEVHVDDTPDVQGSDYLTIEPASDNEIEDEEVRDIGKEVAGAFVKSSLVEKMEFGFGH